MTVTIPTAPFDLGNGQHGIVVEAMDVGWDRPWVLDALQPCETCLGVGWIPANEIVRKGAMLRCPDCHNGKRVVELTVHCELGPDMFYPMTVNGAQPIVGVPGDGYPKNAPTRFVYVSKAGAWRVVDRTDPSDTYIGPVTIPGDPADLVGRYLVLVERAGGEGVNDKNINMKGSA